jgi:ribosomal protein S12 methylthiotransferase
LLDVQEDILARRQEAEVGRTLDVLIEEIASDGAWGRSQADAPEVDCAVRVTGADRIGDLVRVRCTGTLGVDLLAEVEEG